MKPLPPMIDRRRKDGLTWLHQLVTVVGVPALLAVGGWVASEFMSMRDGLHDMQRDVLAIRAEVKTHTGQLNTIWGKLLSSSPPDERKP